MAANIARLLNCCEEDRAKFADYLSEYFDSNEPDDALSSEDECDVPEVGISDADLSEEEDDLLPLPPSCSETPSQHVTHSVNNAVNTVTDLQGHCQPDPTYEKDLREVENFRYCNLLLKLKNYQLDSYIFIQLQVPDGSRQDPLFRELHP